MPWDPEDLHYEYGGKTPGPLGYIRIYQDDMHPGRDIPVARKWVSKVSEEIRIRGTVRKGDTRCGDGVRVRVMQFPAALVNISSLS